MVFQCVIIIIVVTAWARSLFAYNPYSPIAGWTYYVEAARGLWSSTCQYRFFSYPNSCSSIDLWNGAGVNQQFKLISAGSGYFYLQTNCGNYLSYPSACSDTKTIDTWPQAGINQMFKIYKSEVSNFEFYIEAVGRDDCLYRYLSFPGTCSSNEPDHIDFWYATGVNQRFFLHPVSSANPPLHNPISNVPCPDPFAWRSKLPDKSPSSYLLQCTGGGLGLSYSATDRLEADSKLLYQGDCLGGVPASWASNTVNRWAPENYEYIENGVAYNFIFFADSQADGVHRLGWAMSASGASPGAWDLYSPSYLSLGGAPGGDIDGHVFEDPDTNRTYLIWKTDDNAVGSLTTRIWLQEIRFSIGSVSQLSSPVQILDSTGLWWAVSWVAGGSLVEGPEIVKRNGIYYLFFASGQYCQDTYKEGVARSSSIFGPYEKLGVPLLSNGIVGLGAFSGSSSYSQLVGPGHASFVSLGNDEWRIVYHASIGENCNRYAFVDRLVFGSDGWPLIDLD